MAVASIFYSAKIWKFSILHTFISIGFSRMLERNPKV